MIILRSDCRHNSKRRSQRHSQHSTRSDLFSGRRADKGSDFGSHPGTDGQRATLYIIHLIRYVCVFIV